MSSGAHRQQLDKFIITHAVNCTKILKILLTIKIFIFFFATDKFPPPKKNISLYSRHKRFTQYTQTL